MIGATLFPGAPAPAWTPDLLHPGAVWFDARLPDTMTMNAQGRVSHWRDGGGLGHVLRQDNPAHQPVWSAGQLSFTPDQYMVAPSPLPDGAPATLALRLRGAPVGAWDNPLSWWDGAPGTALSIGPDLTWRWYAAPGINAMGDGTVTEDTRFILSLGETRALLIRNGQISQDNAISGSGGLVTNGGEMVLGARGPVISGDRPLEGWGGVFTALALLPQAHPNEFADKLHQWLE